MKDVPAVQEVVSLLPVRGRWRPNCMPQGTPAAGGRLIPRALSFAKGEHRFIVREVSR